MRLLIDSHTLIWAVDDPVRLSSDATVALQDPANELYISAASIWEIAIKYGQGKLKLHLPFHQWMAQAISSLGLTILPITVDYAAAQAGLPNHHHDPFDRFIIAQALTELIPVVGSDSSFDAYGVTRIW